MTVAPARGFGKLRDKRPVPGTAVGYQVPASVEALLHFYRGARFFQLRLDLVGFLLRGALLDRLRGRVDEVLRLLEAETGDGADDLDHLDLLAACLGEDDVEGRLLLGRGAVAACRGAGRCDRDRSGGRDAPLLLDLVLELDQLEDGHLPQLVEDLVDRHYSSSVLSSVVVSSAAGSSAAGSSSATGSSSSGAASASGSGVASASGSGEVSSSPPSCSILASISPTRFCSGALSRPVSAVSGATIAPSTWPRSTSAGGSLARVSTSAAVTVRPCMIPPRISSTRDSRAESASAFAAATMSPSAARNAIALGPSSKVRSASEPAASAARRPSVFFTTENVAPLSRSRVRSRSICGIVRPR